MIVTTISVEEVKTSVRYCMSKAIVDVDRVRKFARHAREYLLVYHALDSGGLDLETTETCIKYGPMALDKLVKGFRTHRCALDFD